LKNKVQVVKLQTYFMAGFNYVEFREQASDAIC